MTDDLEIRIETTWIEDTGSAFDRVVIVEFYTSDCISNDTEAMFRTAGKTLRTRISKKLKNDLGLLHKKDFIFGIYDNPKMQNGKWLSASSWTPHPNGMRSIIRLKNEEHYTMFKLHYHG